MPMEALQSEGSQSAEAVEGTLKKDVYPPHWGQLGDVYGQTAPIEKDASTKSRDWLDYAVLGLLGIIVVMLGVVLFTSQAKQDLGQAKQDLGQIYVVQVDAALHPFPLHVIWKSSEQGLFIKRVEVEHLDWASKNGVEVADEIILLNGETLGKGHEAIKAWEAFLSAKVPARFTLKRSLDTCKRGFAAAVLSGGLAKRELEAEEDTCMKTLELVTKDKATCTDSLTKVTKDKEALQKQLQQDTEKPRQLSVPAQHWPVFVAAPPQSVADVVKEVEKQVELQLESTHREDIAVRNKFYNKLALWWHPDKNLGNEEFAKQIFQFLQNQEDWYLKESPKET